MVWYIQFSWRENVGTWFSTFTVCGKNQLVWDTRNCNGEEMWVGHDVEDREVHDGNDVYMGFRLVEAPMWGIKSPLSKGVWQLGGVGWLE